MEYLSYTKRANYIMEWASILRMWRIIILNFTISNQTKLKAVMFKTLFAVAIAGSANAITDTACTTVSEDKNIYHLSALTRDVGDEYKLND